MDSESGLPAKRIDQELGWRSWKIKKRALIPLSVATGLLLGATLTIIALSSLWHGLLPVEERSSRFAEVDWKLSYAWTLLPSVLFQIYGLCFAAVVDAYGARQPFVELARPEGALAKKSIALDYQSYFPGQREVKAFRRGHWYLCFAFLVADILRVVLGPLAARMMSLKAYAYTQPDVPGIVRDTMFDANPSINEYLPWDLLTVIGAVSGSILYGASPPDGSNGTHGFLNFSKPIIQPLAQNPIANATTSAFFSELECVIMDDVAANMDRVPVPNSLSGNAGRWNIKGIDRNCDWSINMGIAATYSNYLQTFPETNCTEDPQSSSQSRLIVVGASAVNFNNTVPAVLSCMPTYWNASGNLILNLEADSRSPVLGFEESERKILKPQWWKSFETQLNQVQSVDTTVDGGSTADSATAFGRVILDNARRISTEKPLDPNTLATSSQQVFAHAYATVVTQFMIRPSAQTRVQLALTTTTNRLFVDNAVAGVVLVLLFMAAIVISLAYWYGKTPSILFEEPIGLLGKAGVLAKSTVNYLVLANRETPGFCGKTTKDIRQLVEDPEATAVRFITVDRLDPANSRIEIRLDAAKSPKPPLQDSQAAEGLLLRAVCAQNPPSLASPAQPPAPALSDRAYPGPAQIVEDTAEVSPVSESSTPTSSSHRAGGDARDSNEPPSPSSRESQT